MICGGHTLTITVYFMLGITDIDCKMKSAAQTPAPLQNNLHNIVPELLGRPANETQIYYKTVCKTFSPPSVSSFIPVNQNETNSI